ncbi:hypothetical protein D1872_340280 [compost metagenome]
MASCPAYRPSASVPLFFHPSGEKSRQNKLPEAVDVRFFPRRATDGYPDRYIEYQPDDASSSVVPSDFHWGP